MWRQDLTLDTVSQLDIGDWLFLPTTGEDGLSRPDSFIALRFLEGDRGLAIIPIAAKWREEGIKEENIHYVNIHGQDCWEWDGNYELPTLSPSILHWGDGRNKPATWHGYLREGKLVSA